MPWAGPDSCAAPADGSVRRESTFRAEWGYGQTKGVVDEMEKGFWGKMVGSVVGLGVLGLLAFVVFDRMAYRFGMIGAFLVGFGILMAIAYRHDKKKQREYLDDA